MIDFKPSDVSLNGYPPLIDTMGRAEREFAAACIVRGLQETGDEWRPIAWPEVASVLRADRDAGRAPFAELVRNPFFRPDVHDLVARGFAAWVGETGGAVALMDKGMEALRKYVRPRDAPPPAAPTGEEPQS